MATHPYISGPGHIQQMIGLLRKNFPSAITSDTIKKYGLAPNNESYVINALQFLGFIDADGKKTDLGASIFTKHDDSDFQSAFAEAVKSAYSELFELHGDDAWTLERAKLIGYFRQADQTSEAIGMRQASVFQVLAGWSGKEVPAALNNGSSKKAAAKQMSKAKPTARSASNPKSAPGTVPVADVREMSSSLVGLNVRVEVNLPPAADPKTYDAIFRSIREHLMNGR